MSPTISTSVLRCFCLDTVSMPKGQGGYEYLMHASDNVSKWVEAAPAGKNNSKNWAKFIWEQIICRFGCIPMIICDGGPEFKAATREVLEKHNVPLVMSSPYHPHGNGISERDGQTLQRIMFRLCGNRPSLWPLYLHAALLSMRTTASKGTGYTPYFLIYGVHCLFPFDLTDRTWYSLDWHLVKSTEDLLVLRAQQIARRNECIGPAIASLIASRQHSIDDYMKKHKDRVQLTPFAVGTWVLVHETWLDAQHGNKGSPRWAGPYIVAAHYPSGTYAITELDHSPVKEHVAANRLKLFYYRDNLPEPGLLDETPPNEADVLAPFPSFTSSSLRVYCETTIGEIMENTDEHLSCITGNMGAEFTTNMSELLSWCDSAMPRR